MSMIKAAKIQIGLALSALSNFILDASPQDGTLTLKRESGQELMKFGSDGRPTFAQLPTTLADTGSITLANGLVIKWGITNGISNGSSALITYDSPMPNNTFSVVVTYNGTTPSVGSPNSISAPTKDNFRLHNGGTTVSVYRWIAIGG